MIVAGGQLGNGRQLIIIGLEHRNLDLLREGKPAESDVPGLPLVVIHAGPTLRDVVAELVGHGILPDQALDEYEAPKEGEMRTWDPEHGHRVARTDDPGDERAVVLTGEGVNRSRRAAAVEAVLDVIAPRRDECGGARMPVFEWAKETTPDEDELAELAGDVADAVLAVVS